MTAVQTCALPIYVTLLAIVVVQQSDSCGAVRVILDVGDFRWDPVLIRPAKINEAIGPLVPATLMARSDLARIVSATLFGQGPDQRLLGRRARELHKVRRTRSTPTRRGRLIPADSHDRYRSLSVRSLPVN